MSQKLKVNVVLIGVDGKETVRQVHVSPTISATTIKALAEAEGIDLDKKNLMLDGKPVQADAMVTEGAQLRITERPQGS